jgi:hypothetical protein
MQCAPVYHVMNLRLLTCALLPLMASAQLLTFGVRGGAPAETPRGQTDKMPFVFGPTVNIRIASGLSLESGLLYRRLGRGFDSYAILYPENAVTLGYETWRGRALELPFLAKYRFRNGRAGWRPFLSAGPTVRRTSITTDRANTVISAGQFTTGGAPLFNTKSTHWNVDPTVGVGVDFRVGRLHLEPEVRYSYWGASKNTGVRKNQVDFLFGFRF